MALDLKTYFIVGKNLYYGLITKTLLFTVYIVTEHVYIFLVLKLSNKMAMFELKKG